MKEMGDMLLRKSAFKEIVIVIDNENEIDISNNLLA